MNQTVYAELKRIARSRAVTDYTAIGQMIGLDMGNLVDGNKIADVLDEINFYEHQHGRPMLSAVVIRQRKNMPGNGFFECAKQLRNYWGNDDLVFWVHELTRVHNHWQSH